MVLVDPPVSVEVDGLRRAVGDRALGRIAPHVTLVPPVNVPADRLPDALGRLRAAAAIAGSGPFELTLGPIATFLPANPVLVLEVGGDVDRLRALRDAVFRGPFERPLRWPWVPHVTVGDDLDEDRIGAALVALDRFAAATTVDRVTVLEEVRSDEGRRWVPLADARLGSRRIVGRGGLELELTEGRLIDPEAAAVLAASGVDGDCVRRADRAVVVTARQEEVAAGVAAGWVDGEGTHVGVVVGPEERGRGIGSHLLAALEGAMDTAGWDAPQRSVHGPAGFYRARSARYSKATDE